MPRSTDVIGYAYNADTWCPSCFNEHAPLDLLKQRDPASPIFADAESDTPMHCCQCHEFLGGQLTDAGVRYVIEALETYINNGHGDPATLDTWASELHDYSLDGDQERTLDGFNAVRTFQRRRQKMHPNVVPMPAHIVEKLGLHKVPLIVECDTSALEVRLLSEYMHAHSYAHPFTRGRTPHRFPL